MNHKTTLLELLKQDTTITFPSGYVFKGDSKTGYIDLISPLGKDGLENLNEEGLDKAFGWKNSWEYEES